MPGIRQQRDRARDQAKRRLADDKGEVQPDTDRERAIVTRHRRVAVAVAVAVRMPVMIAVPWEWLCPAMSVSNVLARA